ncbi:MAG: lysine--tRNA ligase [Planctomycetes bacterium]|nr:lysine--tRNA ligase [Planctomycetota bacterium]
MLEKVQEDRLKKLQAIRDLGYDPYGGRYGTAEPIEAVLKKFDPARAEAHGDKQPDYQRADAAGRVILLRDMGKMIFAHIRDQSGQMQICLRKDQPGKPPAGLVEKPWALAKLLDLGDIVAVKGVLAKTRTGEITIFADDFTLLCKSLLPMPEKYHGLTDIELRSRQRYLDLMANPDSMRIFQKRVAIIEHFRGLLKGRGFVEVETPMLQSVYGGAAARPFTTHHNALDIDLFMRISPELSLKRLLVGGMEKVFEINRNFRNEGISPRHNPEFTMMELYQAYADYEVMMEITEELVYSSAKNISLPYLLDLYEKQEEAEEKLREDKKDTEKSEHKDISQQKWQKHLKEHEDAYTLAETPIYNIEMLSDIYEASKENKTKLPFVGERLIDYTRPWPRKTYLELMQEYAGVDMRDEAAVAIKAKELGLYASGKAHALLVNNIFEMKVEPELAKMDRPVFVKDYPAELCPLTRRKADDPSIALRFECYIAGMEVANAYTELNDPAIQEENFNGQLAGEKEGETMRVMDEDFVTALRHGMPPAGGLGIGIDRVVMLLTNTASIRDVILFPLLRPEEK